MITTAHSPLGAPATVNRRGLPWRVLLVVMGWFLLYVGKGPASRWLTLDLLRLDPRSRFGAAVEFFVFETPKVLLLLVAVVYVVGIIRTYFTPERTRTLLAGRREIAGNALAAALGIVTPFCSCSAVPLFIGFVESGVPLGVTFSFLIAAPMINEVAVVLLFGLVGPAVTALYVATGLTIAISAGWLIGRLGLEHLVEDWVHAVRVGPAAPDAPLTLSDRMAAGRQALRDVVGKVWLYVVVGIGVGSFIHGFVPEQALASVLGRGAWWAVPAAVAIGVPMYSNAAGIVPVVQALLGKGAALGSALAFMMSVTALSLPEMVILRKVLRPPLMAAFIGTVAAGIVLVGYLFNALL
ncbi:MAG: permease [Gemmatimonadaceae bacterium]